jgi:hypothetical protein
MSFTIDAAALVEESTSRETFDVLEFVKASNLPTLDVTVYTDGDAALKLARIFVEEAAREKKAAEESLSIDDEYDGPDEDTINELHQRLTSSALVFHLRGLAPSAVRALENSLTAKLGKDTEEFTEEFNNTLIAKTIVSVETADGRISDKSWTAKQVATLNDSLYISEANKLFNGAAEVNFVGAIFDRAVNADFS